MKQAYLLIRICYWLRLAKIDIDYLSAETNPLILRKAKRLKTAAEEYEMEIKSRGKYLSHMFEDFSKEKIFAIQSVIDKMLLMSESDCLALESSFELIEK